MRQKREIGVQEETPSKWQCEDKEEENRKCEIGNEGGKGESVCLWQEEFEFIPS